MKQPSLFDLDPGSPAPPGSPDQAARQFAIDPSNDVVLEASAGTGKTRVLVDRYVRLIQAGVLPRHILAITFTRKAAAEMRERVLEALRRAAADGTIPAERWHELSNRISDIQISTIDAFCYSLLREFPLEAGVEPGFDIADETEMGRFAREAMDRALTVSRGLLEGDESLRLLFARIKPNVLRMAVEELLDRRHVAVPAVATFVQRLPPGTASAVADAFVDRIRQLLQDPAHRSALLEMGPGAPEFRWLRADLTSLDELSGQTMPRVQQLRRRLERYFLTSKGTPRLKIAPSFKVSQFAGTAERARHEQALVALAPGVKDALENLELAVNSLLARGLLRLLRIASDSYEALLEEHALLDFAGMLERAVELLSRQEEFARSRLKLQSRFHHLLIDEFQDTSRLQWRLMELLVDAWGEGESAADAPTSIFIVGDRKQSIYRFRHAEVTLLDEAAGKIAALRPGRRVRQAISSSFRAVPELLAFVNALAEATQSTTLLPERFTYLDHDRFPSPGIGPGALRDGQPVLGVVAEPTLAACASAVAAEIDRLIGRAVVRDREGPPRLARADDIAILFRARTGHQLFENALEARDIRTYVYKGLGFFDAPEVQDLQALLRMLAQPDSDLRAAEFLRSRLVRISDDALARLAPGLAGALLGDAPAALETLLPLDRALLERARLDLTRWLELADRLPPSEVVDLVLRESAYAFEIGGRRADQARENLKKVRSLIRRVESRGYATLSRIAEYFETLRAGDESHAILEASGCVNLMTMHAAKGLEFPIVFLVNVQIPGRSRGGGFSIIEKGPAGEPEVAFKSTDGTRLEDERDTEELRRLLYVGVTRARDRLYLAGQIDAKQQLRRPARSLASLLPASLADLFRQAAADPTATRVTWSTPEHSFSFGVCRATPVDDDRRPVGAVPPESLVFDTTPLDASRSLPRVAASREAAETGLTARPLADQASHRVTGTVVHRLLQRRADPDLDPAMLVRAAAATLSSDERLDVANLDEVLRRAAHRYQQFAKNAELRTLLGSGRAYFEVPFSHALTGSDGSASLVRGVVDCLVVGEDGTATVIEFKTGLPAPAHETQALQYQAAIRAILGKNHVELKILYA